MEDAVSSFWLEELAVFDALVAGFIQLGIGSAGPSHEDRMEVICNPAVPEETTDAVEMILDDNVEVEEDPEMTDVNVMQFLESIEVDMQTEALPWDGTLPDQAALDAFDEDFAAKLQIGYFDEPLDMGTDFPRLPDDHDQHMALASAEEPQEQREEQMESFYPDLDAVMGSTNSFMQEGADAVAESAPLVLDPIASFHDVPGSSIEPQASQLAPVQDIPIDPALLDSFVSTAENELVEPPRTQDVSSYPGLATLPVTNNTFNHTLNLPINIDADSLKRPRTSFGADMGAGMKFQGFASALAWAMEPHNETLDDETTVAGRDKLVPKRRVPVEPAGPSPSSPQEPLVEQAQQQQPVTEPSVEELFLSLAQSPEAEPEQSQQQSASYDPEEEANMMKLKEFCERADREEQERDSLEQSAEQPEDCQQRSDAATIDSEQPDSRAKPVECTKDPKQRQEEIQAGIAKFARAVLESKDQQSRDDDEKLDDQVTIAARPKLVPRRQARPGQGQAGPLKVQTALTLPDQSDEAPQAAKSREASKSCFPQHIIV